MAEDQLQTIIVIAVAGGFIAGLIAASRGLSFLGFFILGTLFPLIGIVLALIAQGPGKWAHLTPAPGQGWWPDPTGRFEHRWFDGNHWTRHVGRNGARYEDPG
jgi:Protein of unknown function (DUF2510)